MLLVSFHRDAQVKINSHKPNQPRNQRILVPLVNRVRRFNLSILSQNEHQESRVSLYLSQYVSLYDVHEAPSEIIWTLENEPRGQPAISKIAAVHRPFSPLCLRFLADVTRFLSGIREEEVVWQSSEMGREFSVDGAGEIPQ